MKNVYDFQHDSDSLQVKVSDFKMITSVYKKFRLTNSAFRLLQNDLTSILKFWPQTWDEIHTVMHEYNLLI